ncbi:MAG TPA: transposase [Acidobacteriota bacterium]|nr:transposase [Acidobacteriota bacterium]
MRYRKRLRSPLHDYKKSGAYFVTICSNDGLELFGSVKNKLILNDAGVMVERVWQQMPNRFSNISLDCYVVMPNHFHAIVALGMELINGEWLRLDEKLNPSISEVIAAFKSITTLEYSESVHEKGWQPFRRRLWQRLF